ncbi:cell division cycle 7-related protein kinase-like [Babylonia areolata]|uniref:cell division cycle 7-related protein kinase-like n=1 Tax=Babylonia areolata TaxID=304850 RepID=UPI003FD021FF
MDFELSRDQLWEMNCVEKQQKKKSDSEKSDELPVAVQQEIEDLCYFIPEVTNHFNVLDKIGEGTFSSVFLANLKHPNDIKEKFALKHIIPTSHPNRIIAELKCLQLFGGRENVMGVELCLKNRDHIVIIMRYFPHQKFLEYFNTFDVSQVRDYMKNLLVALRHIHKFDIIHRDVKPTNFLHNIETKKYALVDFGLAQDAPLKLREENKDKPPVICLWKGKENSQEESQTEEPKPDEQKGTTRTPLSPLPQGKMASPRARNNPEISQSSQSASPQRTSKHRRLPPPPPLLDHSKQKLGRCPQKSTQKVSDAGRSEQKAVATKDDAGKYHGKSVTTGKDVKTGSASSRPVLSTPRSAGLKTGKVAERIQDSKRKRGSRSRVKQEGQTACMCYGRPSICTFCSLRPVETAPRAGTPGFRAPEVLMKHPNQSTAVDIWAAGVIFLSLLSGRYPFFRGNDDMTCLSQILSLLGTDEVKKAALSFDKLITARPRTRALELKSLCERLRANNPDPLGSKQPTQPTRQWPKVPDCAVKLLKRMLDPNPATRITAEQALASDFFMGEEEEKV